MNTLSEQLTRLATTVGEAIGHLEVNTGDVANLTTQQKTNLVAAINEVVTRLDALPTGQGAVIDDMGAPSTSTVWSSARVAEAIRVAVEAAMPAAPASGGTV